MLIWPEHMHSNQFCLQGLQQHCFVAGYLSLIYLFSDNEELLMDLIYKDNNTRWNVLQKLHPANDSTLCQCVGF